MDTKQIKGGNELTIRIGILGAAAIAVNKFLPATLLCEEVEYAGVSSRSKRSIEGFQKFNGKYYDNYEDILNDKTIDAVYIPLYPAAHFPWALKALEANKHVLLEKPFTMNQEEAVKLIAYAESRNLVIVENFSFQYHNQFIALKEYIESGTIGNIKEISARFGYPGRNADDFRYCKNLGGGALLDCGVYPIKVASLLLGSSCRVHSAVLNYDKEIEIDLFGNATLVNEDGMTAHISFGMDNEYQCVLDIWGSKGCIKLPRIFTAPDTLEPNIIITKSGIEEQIKAGKCNQFARMLDSFAECMKNESKRKEAYQNIRLQSQLVDDVVKAANMLDKC